MEELARYERGFALLTEAIAGVSEELLHYKPSEQAWSIKEIVIHVCDTEIVAHHRMKQVIAESDPALIAFDQDLWTSRLRYEQLDMKLHLELFRLLRESMMPILQSMKDEDWTRSGIHSEAGKLTLRDLLVHFANHVETHVNQIERNKRSFADR